MGFRVGLVRKPRWGVFGSVLWPKAPEEAVGGKEGEMDTATKRRAVWLSDVEQAATGGAFGEKPRRLLS